MKNLSISKNNYELARTPLNKAVITVGRSPNCDLVLRAPGVKAEHFIIRWNGSGDFDPSQDRWCIEDLSNGAASHTYLLSEIENQCAGFAFKKDNSAYKAESVLGGTLLRELSVKDPSPLSATRDLELVWMSARGSVKEVKHLNLESLSGRLLTPFDNIPAFKIMGVEDVGASKIYLRIFSSGLKNAVVLINGKDVSFEDIVLKDNSTIRLAWGKEMLFLRLVSRIAPPKEKSKKFEPLLAYSSILATLFLTTMMFVAANSKLNTEVAQEEPQLIKIEIPAEEDSTPPAASAAVEVEPASEKSISLETPKEVPVARMPEVIKESVKAMAKSGAAPSSGMQGGGRDIAASKVLSLLSKNKLAKGTGLSPKDILNAEVPSQTISGINENAPVMINRMPGGVIGRGKGGAPDGTGEDTGLVAAASTSKLNMEPGATSLGKVGTLGNGKGASFSKVGNGNGNGKGNGLYGNGTGNALFDSKEVAVVGGLDRETVRRVIAGQKGKVQVCYDKALVMNPDVGGRIVYKWKIQPTGNVTATAITKSRVASRILEGCVESVIKDMLFPKALNGATTTVIYPFEFFAKN